MYQRRNGQAHQAICDVNAGDGQDLSSKRMSTDGTRLPMIGNYDFGTSSFLGYYQASNTCYLI